MSDHPSDEKATLRRRQYDTAARWWYGVFDGIGSDSDEMFFEERDGIITVKGSGVSADAYDHASHGSLNGHLTIKTNGHYLGFYITENASDQEIYAVAEAAFALLNKLDLMREGVYGRRS